MIDQIREVELPNQVRAFYLPIFDTFGDGIPVYGLETAKGYVLVDDGEIFTNWSHSGLDITSEQKHRIEKFCHDHHMWIEDEEIQRKVEPTNLRAEAYRFGLDLMELNQLVRE